MKHITEKQEFNRSTSWNVTQGTLLRDKSLKDSDGTPNMKYEFVLAKEPFWFYICQPQDSVYNRYFVHWL